MDTFQENIRAGNLLDCQMQVNRISVAENPDATLKYDDWEEDWQSIDGYWIEDDPSDDTVMTITVFIKELLDDELFEQY